MYRDDRLRLKHMLDAATQARDFAKDKRRNDLESEPMLLHALVRLIEIIGEAANGISSDFQNNHPEIPWIDIISMRNRLIHRYFDINLDVVWKTIDHDIPMLIEQLNKLSGDET